ncbi:lysosomal Pro-X carboxypeptidase [Lasioglossum baleicum]|uniref:lysosomal Pro-X carboxypeptidase n=1 Tax=Lasioglossum baleicum TaxID=434251 RepID=UPI003FCDC58F
MEFQYVLLVIFFMLWQPSSSRFLSHRFNSDFKKELHNANYKYEIKTIEMPVDHFSFSVEDTFKLRYLINDTWQQENAPPIFFYTGNEGNIEVFAQNTGFMWEIAAEFHALVIFAEHRYYGESMPYGNKSYNDSKHLGYLTSQQALADYVDLIQYLKSSQKYKQSPVIVFGGSYGGMLSAWIRMKYPHIVQGAIAASAPILQFTGIVDCGSFNRILSSDFKMAHPNCPDNIKKSWTAINNVASSDAGKTWLSDNWKLCEPLKNNSQVKQLKDYLKDIYGNLAMMNYPYKANFLAPLPAYPVNAVCRHLTNGSLTGKDLLLAVYQAINVYTNYTGDTKCLNINDTDLSSSLDARGWPYQACTEMVMPMCSTGINDMFEREEWNFNEYAKDCEEKFSVKPQPNLACKQYGCTDLSTATNIVFSNGLMDPWTGGGVVRNLSVSAVAIIIPEGAHHLDLRGSHKEDPRSVILTRNYHRYYIRQWIKEYFK